MLSWFKSSNDLMRSYLITDVNYYGNSSTSFFERLNDVLIQHTPDFALYRDKENSDYLEYAREFIDLCAQHVKTKAMLHSDVGLAVSLGAYGVHLTSLQFVEIKSAKEQGLFTVVSCHNEEDVLKAQELGADAVTYSPIFSTPNKGEPKGLAELQRMVDKISIPIIALGGIITSEQVKAVERTGCYGFASIRYFVEN